MELVSPHSLPAFPNVVPGRPLNATLFASIFSVFFRLAARSRTGMPCGLLPGASSPLVSLSRHGDLSIGSVEAIGTNGFPISHRADDEDTRARALDCAKLPEGTHDVYLCPDENTVESGDLIVIPDDANGVGPVSYRESRSYACRLVAGEAWRSRLDGIQVARVIRRREGMADVYELDRTFHPPVVSMAAWLRPDPVRAFVDRVLKALEANPLAAPADHPLRGQLLDEVLTLDSLGIEASVESVFLWTTKCLRTLSRVPNFPIRFPDSLLSHRFGFEQFPRFLVELEESLERKGQDEGWPALMSFDGTRCQHLAGTFVADGEAFAWTPPKTPYYANSLCLWMPGASSLTFPETGVTFRENDSRKLASRVTRFEGGGAALLLPPFHGEITRIVLSVQARREHLRLAQYLGDPHALYGC